MNKIIIVVLAVFAVQACSDTDLSSSGNESSVNFKELAKTSNLQYVQFVKTLQTFINNIPLDARTGKCNVEVAAADFNNDTYGDFAISSRCSPENKSTKRRVGYSWDLFLAYVTPEPVTGSALNTGADMNAIEYKKLNNIYFNAEQVVVKPHQKNQGLVVMYLKENSWEGHIIEITVDYDGMKRLAKIKAEKNEKGKALLEKTFGDRTLFPIFYSSRLADIEAL